MLTKAMHYICILLASTLVMDTVVCEDKPEGPKDHDIVGEYDYLTVMLGRGNDWPLGWY